MPMDSRGLRGRLCTSYTQEDADDWYLNDDDELDEEDFIWDDDELGLDPPQLREEE